MHGQNHIKGKMWIFCLQKHWLLSTRFFTLNQFVLS